MSVRKMTGFSRRDLLALLGAAALQPAASAANRAPPRLPLDTPGLDHLDLVVPDVEKSARFYAGLFDSPLHAQPFRGGFRYFVLLGPLPPDRAVGYVAIGAAFGRPTGIGHFCTSVVDWRQIGAAIFDEMKVRFASTGFGDFPGGAMPGGTFVDPDGIEIQFLPAPDTLVTAAVPAELAVERSSVVRPRRLEFVEVEVSDLDRAVAYYRTLYGREKSRRGGRAIFRFPNGTALQLSSTGYAYGRGRPRISRFGVRAHAFDAVATRSAVERLGGTVVGGDARTLQLRDPDGIAFDLVAG